MYTNEITPSKNLTKIIDRSLIHNRVEIIPRTRPYALVLKQNYFRFLVFYMQENGLAMAAPASLYGHNSSYNLSNRNKSKTV
jgi:hypothetical protein